MSFAVLGKSQESRATSSRKITEDEPDFLRSGPNGMPKISPRKVTSDFALNKQKPDNPDSLVNVFNLNEGHKRSESGDSNPFDVNQEMR